MASSRRTPRAVSVSRATTPSDAGGNWNAERLRPRQPSAEAPALSPTKVTRTAVTRASGANRVFKASSVVGSVSQSVAGSDSGSLDPTTGLRRTTGHRSRNARAGTTGNSYGAVVDAQSSQMASGNPLNGLKGSLDSQLQQESSQQKVRSWRVDNDLDEGSPERNLSAVREESEELLPNKSFGPLHEYGMGQTGSRNKSFSVDHEDGIANPFHRQFAGEPVVDQREFTPDHVRHSPAPRASSRSPRIDTPENWLPYRYRARFWYNGYKNTIRSILALIGLLLFGCFYGQALWKSANYHLTPPTTLPDDAMPPTATITSHETTTVTQIIKETSVIAPRPLIQERLNFFNMEVGAKIDPRLTSTTRAPKNLFYSVLAPFSGRWVPGPIVNQADTALKPWTETGQSWCAASSDLGQGQLQLGIYIPFTLRPLAVTLEHQLEHLSFDTTNSARHVELWVESHEHSSGANIIDCGPTPDGMDEFWFCVAKMEFSRFNGEEKSQRIEFRNEYVFTNHFAFRVLDNWGSDHTCLYRIQMHGELKLKLEDGASA